MMRSWFRWNSIFSFFWREKSYTLLFLTLVLCYGYLWLVTESHDGEFTESSRVMAEYRLAEQKVQKDIERIGSIEKFLENKPLLNKVFNYLSFLATGAFSLGIIINFFLLFNPAWRRSLTLHDIPVGTTPWKISMFFKVLLLWIGASLILNFFIYLIRQIFFPQVPVNFFLLLHTTLSDIFCVCFIFFIIREAGGHWRDLGLWVPKGKAIREVVIGLGGYLAILPVFLSILIFLAYVAGLFSYEPPPHPLVTVFLEEERRAPFLIFYSIFLAGILAPVFEEIFFRGFCYTLFKKQWGMMWGMVLSSALFAFIHQNTFAFWPIFILGMGMAYLYEKRRTLLPAIVLHVSHNLIFIGYFFFAKQVVNYGLV
ncbi:MAG: CPBP family intramembrane metalloprotease [Candidatus Omnitrophica bacterium]|nr:CPBP family intramembrane metalloprotease [Candidatus Omnitrophota bacterium]